MRDSWLQILYLLICETLKTAFDIGMMYEPLVFRYGKSLTHRMCN